MNSVARFIAAVVVFAAMLMPGAHAQQGKVAPASVPEQPSPTGLPPLLEKLGEGVYRLGGITVDRKQRTIVFPAQVNMDSGMLEYLIVHRKGKTHESLLNTLIEPYNLQIAFLLLDFLGSEEKLGGQGSPDVPKGDAITVLIRNQAGERVEEIPAEHWLVHRMEQGDRNVPPMDWVYTGSMRVQQYFLAQETGSIAAIWHDPAALIDNASPGGESNRIWFVKQGTVPSVGTPVEVIIKPAQPKK